jgi:hypothetical protein
MYCPRRSVPADDGVTLQSIVHTAPGASARIRPRSSSRLFRRWTPTWMLRYPAGTSGLGPQVAPGRALDADAHEPIMGTISEGSACAPAAEPAIGVKRSSEVFGEPDEKSFRPSNVAQPIAVFVLDDFAADKLRAVVAEAAERFVDVVHGEHDA